MIQYSSEEVLKFLESKETYRLNLDWLEAEGWEHFITCPICETINRVQNKGFSKNEPNPRITRTKYKIGGRHYKLWQKVLGQIGFPVVLLLLLPTVLFEVSPQLTFMMLLVFGVVPFLCVTCAIRFKTPIYKMICESCGTELFVAHRRSDDLHFPRIAILTVNS